MNKEEYIKELQKRLKLLPKEDREDAVNYYEEFICEMELNEGESICDRIGTPKEVAKAILGETTEKQLAKQKEEKSVKGGAKVVWLTILAIFSIPILIPIGICVWVLFLALGITALALVVAGIVSFTALFAPAPIGQKLVVVGVGMLLIGLGMFLGIGVVQLIQLTARLMVKIVKRK